MPIASSCKPSENGDGFALRLWNPTSKEWNGVLASDLDLRVEPCDLLERPTGLHNTDEGTGGKICVPAGGIATFTMR